MYWKKLYGTSREASNDKLHLRASYKWRALIPSRILRVLVILAEKLERTKTSRAVTGSTSLALQGVELVPNDIDIMTDEEGAYAIARLFGDHIVSPVSYRRSPKYESHFGRLEIDGVGAEIMGNLRVFRGGRLLPVMTPSTRKIEKVGVEKRWIPVVSLTSLKDSGYLEERLGNHGTSRTIEVE